jgi:NAD(P)-dependent dehydrogenase (short-subunit alcohol dehydrogenase family)
VRLLVTGADVAAARCLETLARDRGAEVVRASRASSEEEIEGAFEDAGDAPLAGVVHVMSVPAPGARIGEWSLADWERTIVGGLRSAFLLARRAVDEMLAGGDGGRLTVLVSAEGAEGEAGREILRGSLHALVRSVAKEYGPRGITCNAVLAATGSPRDLELAAGTVWTLVSPEGAYVTGELIDLAPA